MERVIAWVGISGDQSRELARGLARPGYRQLLSDCDMDLASRLAEEIVAQCPEAAVEALACTHHACWEADILMVEAPADAAALERLRDVACQKLVISLDADGTHTAQLRSLLPNSHVVQVSLNPDGRAQISSPDAEALEESSRLVQAAGYQIVSGPAD